jgi:hypothetical protein
MYAVTVYDSLGDVVYTRSFDLLFEAHSAAIYEGDHGRIAEVCCGSEQLAICGVP